MTPLGGRDPADLWTRLGELRQQLEQCDRTLKELNGALLVKLHGEYYEFAEEFWKPHGAITDQKEKAELIRQFEEAPQAVAIARAVERQQDALARIPDLIRQCSDVVSFLQSHNSEVKAAADILRGIAQQPRVEDGARVLGIVAQALASQKSPAGHSGFVHRDALPTASESGQALWPEGSCEQNGLRSGDAILSLRKPDGTVVEGIPAEFSEKAILIMDVAHPIEKGDMLIRTLPCSLRVGFIVDDPGRREAIGSIPAHFEVEAHRAAPIDSLESSGFWRFEQLASSQRRAQGKKDLEQALQSYNETLAREGDRDLIELARILGAYAELLYDSLAMGYQGLPVIPVELFGENGVLFGGSTLAQVKYDIERVRLPRPGHWPAPQNLGEDHVSQSLRHSLQSIILTSPVSFTWLLDDPWFMCELLKCVDQRVEYWKKKLSGDNSPRPADASPQVLKIGKRRGRRANQERRDAIRNAISKHGDQWRDHLNEIFTELDSQAVAIGDLQAMKIDLGDGQSAPVLKWADLELTVGDQRRQIVDTLRKYTE